MRLIWTADKYKIWTPKSVNVIFIRGLYLSTWKQCYSVVELGLNVLIRKGHLAYKGYAQDKCKGLELS